MKKSSITLAVSLDALVISALLSCGCLNDDAGTHHHDAKLQTRANKPAKHVLIPLCASALCLHLPKA